uniref:probable E3 ubiquitin-protein ligase HERC3 isoform X1 n=1 Tax=Styela clava TaxID=7725 RepID=UPI00193A58FC|nr:probable E3 ubiquitin-protein ligase HERC3 isoform X1 [Styela clava]
MASKEDGVYVCGIGFNKFSQIDCHCDIIVNKPIRFDGKIVSVMAGSRNAIILKRDDGTLTIRGFWSNCQRCEINISKRGQCATLKEDELFVVDSEGILYKYSNETNEEVCNQMASPPSIKQIDLVENSSTLFGVTESGNVYRWNEDNIPTQIVLLTKISQISCGVSHVLACSESGNVYTWGTGSRGQLGHSSLEDAENPKLIDMLCGVNIKAVAAGGWHSLSLAESGDIYAWGWNEVGQLGFPATTLTDFSETKLEGDKSVSMLSTPALLELEKYLGCDGYLTLIDISCGSRHSATVTSKGAAITWGWAKYGQLGHLCCVSNSEKNNSLTFMEKRSRNNFGNSCNEKAHLPGFVVFPDSNCSSVASVRCCAWSTFFKMHCVRNNTS